MGKHIEVLARGVCVIDNALLVCHTRAADNTYLPGGHVEHGETASRSLEREIREELGMRGRAGRFLGVVEHTFRQHGKWVHEINLVFLLSIPALADVRRPKSKEGHLDFKWLPLTRLKRSNLEPSSLRKILPLIFSKPVAGPVWEAMR